MELGSGMTKQDSTLCHIGSVHESPVIIHNNNIKAGGAEVDFDCNSLANFDLCDSVKDFAMAGGIPNQHLNFDFQNGYDCGEEPSDASEPEPVESSSDEDPKEIEGGGDKSGEGSEDEEETNVQPLVTGDVYLLGGDHCL
jgi:hypothetical protein